MGKSTYTNSNSNSNSRLRVARAEDNVRQLHRLGKYDNTGGTATVYPINNAVRTTMNRTGNHSESVLFSAWSSEDTSAQSMGDIKLSNIQNSPSFSIYSFAEESTARHGRAVDASVLFGGVVGIVLGSAESAI